MEGGEMMNLIKVCFSVLICLCYCYWIRKLVPAGITRLVFVLPIVCFNFLIPLSFSSVHLSGTIGFFLAWLANFKLLLFSFDKGPLSSHKLISLSRFVAVACLPIKIQQHQPHAHSQNGLKNPHPHPDQAKSFGFDTDPVSKTPKDTRKYSAENCNTDNDNTLTTRQSKLTENYITDNCSTHITKQSELTGWLRILFSCETKSFMKYAIKGVVVGVLVKVYDYSDHIHQNVIMCMYSFHIYFLLEIILAMVAALARTVMGLELEPQFNNPLCSTSLQDFWGRRWNLMVTSILRPTVYEPTLKVSENIIGTKWAPLPAVFGTFLVSGFMHELIFFYLGRLRPTFMMTWFFVLHGICLTVEIALKKVFASRCRLPWIVSGPLTAGFVFVTCNWLFMPEFIRCQIDVKAFQEYAALGQFLKNITSSFTFHS